MKKQIIKLALISLIAGTACVPQQIDAMNWKYLPTSEEIGIKFFDGISKFLSYFQLTEEQLNKKLLNAVQNNNLKEVQWCLDNGANIETQDGCGWTPLMLATYCNKIDIVKLFIKNGAHINAKNMHGKTSLMHAAIVGSIDIFKILIQNGAHIDARDNKGWTSLMWAVRYKNTNTVKLCIESGANQYALDKEKNNVFDIFIKYHGQSYRNAYQSKILSYLVKVHNEFNNFNENPTTWTIDALHLPDVSQSTFIKIMCNKHIFYINAAKHTDLCFLFTAFYKANKEKDLKQFLDQCKFLNCNKEMLKKLHTIGFPLTSNEFDMKLILSEHQNSNKFTDLIIE